MAHRNQAFPVEFRQRAVELDRSGGRSIDKVAKELGISSTTLATWSQQARIDAGEQVG